MPKKLPKKKNDNFSHFAKHRFIKKNRYVATPLFLKKCVFLNLHSLKPNTDVEQKTKLKIRKKAKIRKGTLQEKRREETNKNEKGLMKKNFLIEYFDVVLFKKQKHRRKKKEKETNTRNKKEAKKKDKKDGRKKRKTERQRKRK